MAANARPDSVCAGRRLPDGFHKHEDSVAGDYWRAPDGAWEINDPNGNIGRLGGHLVEEHSDGTITVTPSILDKDPGGYHGWLRRGVWTSA